MTYEPAEVVGPEVQPGPADADLEAGAGLWLDAWRDLRRRPLWSPR